MRDGLYVEVTIIGQGRARTAQCNCVHCGRLITFDHDWAAKAHCQHVFVLCFPRLGIVEAHFTPLKEK